MDQSTALRLQLLLVVVLLVLQPLVLVVFGVGAPVLHPVLLRCARVKWPFWYSCIELLHSCTWIPMTAASLLLVSAAARSVARPGATLPFPPLPSLTVVRPPPRTRATDSCISCRVFTPCACL
jgi:hypothetical protein